MEENLKQLLLKDLCARLPYGVKAILSEYHIDEIPYNGTYCDKVINLGISGETINLLNHIEKYGVRPYLRPMSSMTEEEKREYQSLQDTACSYHYEFGDIVDDFLYFDNDVSLDYLNSIHIDYRGLIEKGLALEAPEGMYK